MDYKQIEFLLEKYWQCRTTLEEEEELKSCLRGKEKWPAELEEYRTFFEYQQLEKSVRLDEDFDRKVLNLIQVNKKVKGPWQEVFLRIAAIALLLIAIAAIALRHRSPELPQEQTPQQALAEVRQALNFVSLKLNWGQQMVGKNMYKIEEATRIIKE